MFGGVHQAFAGEYLGDIFLFNCSNVLLIQVSADDHYRNPKDRGHLELVGRLTCVVHNVHVYVDDKTSGCCLLRFTNSGVVQAYAGKYRCAHCNSYYLICMSLSV